jgi:hypothetical protein
MSRTFAAVVTAALVVSGLGACGLGDRQAEADRIERAGKVLLASPSIGATLSAEVKIVKSDKPLIPGPPRVSPGLVKEVGVVMDPSEGRAAVGTDAALTRPPAIVFDGATMFQRIAVKTVTDPTAAVRAPSNFNAIANALSTQALVAPVVPTTTTTTAPGGDHPLLRRRLHIVRDWAKFDFAAIADHDRTKHAGSYAVNPVDLVRLSTGVLTGSIKRVGTTGDLTRYDGNVSRDKAERKLSEDAREVLDKEFTANAITRRVFPATFWLDKDGRLAILRIAMRQQLTNVDRADLTITLVLAPFTKDVSIAAPSRTDSVTVSSLGQLVTTVTGV